jgi:biotin carboxylase
VQADPKVLVVGTTADYIDWIRRSCPGRAVFLTDPKVRRQAQELCPAAAEEILCDLSDYDRSRQVIQRHLDQNGFRLEGIACYDCESMELAAHLGQSYDLPYPSIQAVNNCRNKFLSKTLWQAHDLHTPKARIIRSETEAAHFFQEFGGLCVLKPLSGSGSELIYRCDSIQECEHNYREIRNGLNRSGDNRLFRSLSAPEPAILAEEFIAGNEYSCDFVIDKERVEIIRITRKIISAEGPFGTALGYLLPGILPAETDEPELCQTLYRSAAALGLRRAICMLDFMIDNGRIVLLEMAPRPGGDCLPFLLRHCYHLDVLKLLLDFSRQRPLRLNRRLELPPSVGLRLHARQSGILKKIDSHRLQSDARISEIHLTRQTGHLIKMPPDDYDSWLLGHIIFEPDGDSEVESQCLALLDKLIVEIE